MQGKGDQRKRGREVNTISEYQHQVAIVSRCKHENILIHSNENSLQFPIPTWFKPAIKEEIRKILHRLAQKRIKAGQLNGLPDLFVPLYRLYIEMKKPGGRATKDQLKVHEQLRECGYDVIIAYSAEQAWEYIQKKRSN